MRMEELKSGDHVGAGTNRNGGILVSIWVDDVPGGARALLTVRETEWLIEKLQESIETARQETNKAIVTL